MNHFEYTAQCKGGAAISGTLDAEDGARAMEQLSAMGLSRIELRKADRPPLRRPLGSDDFIFFNEQLAGLANAGICLDEGLRQLGKDVHSRRLGHVFEAIADDIQHGQPLHEAMERHAPQLPPLYARVVRAGVETGRLPATLLNLSHHLRLVAETRRLLAEALTYPAVVLVLALGVFCAVLLFIVPQFTDAFMDFDIRLPSMTVAIIALSRALPEVLGIGAIILAVGVLLFFMLRLSAGGRALRERIVLRVPVLGPMIGHSLRARFLRAMAFAVDSGMPMPEALRLSAGATGSPALLGEADDVASRVEQGATMDDACRRTCLIPRMFGYFVTVNSEAPTLRDGLIQLSKAYESRAVHSQSLLRGWVAPLAVCGVGVIIGLLIVSLFMPLVQLIQCVSG